MAVIAEFDIALREATPQGDQEPDQIRFCGELIAVADEVSNVPLMRFAHAITSNDVSQLDTLAASYRLLQHCIAPRDWVRFEQLASERMVGAADVSSVAGAVYRHVTGRPTRRPSDSSDGPLPTTETSKPDSSSPASAPASARPDLAVPMVSVDALV